MLNVTRNYYKNINTDILHHPISIGEVHTFYMFSTAYGRINFDASYRHSHSQHMVIVTSQRWHVTFHAETRLQQKFPAESWTEVQSRTSALQQCSIIKQFKSRKELLWGRTLMKDRDSLNNVAACTQVKCSEKIKHPFIGLLAIVSNTKLACIDNIPICLPLHNDKHQMNTITHAHESTCHVTIYTKLSHNNDICR